MAEEAGNAGTEGAPAAGTGEQGEPKSLLDTVGKPSGDPAAPSDWPEWVPEQFRKDKASGKDLVGDDGKPNWEAIAAKASKSFKDTQQKLGAFTGAPVNEDGSPADYELAVPQGMESVVSGIDKENPLLQTFQNLCRESNVSQEFFSKVLSTYLEHEVPNQIAMLQEEKELLGPHADQLLQGIAEWGVANLDADGQQTLRNGIYDAGSARMAKMFIEHFASGPKVPTSNEGAMGGGMANSEDGFKALYADDRYYSDASFRARVDSSYAEWLKRNTKAA